MSRRRVQGFCEAKASPEEAFLEESDLVEPEPDEELLSSVSEITEHLGRNISVVLETALSDIRKMVSVRIRVLRMELREKTEEIESLKARLEAQEREPLPPLVKHYGGEPRKGKPAASGVKKENINAICDFLMKDKNLRAEAEEDSASEDIFGILPGPGKRIFDYEWMAGADYSTDPKGIKEPKSESMTPAHEDEMEDDEAEGSSEALGSHSRMHATDFTAEEETSPGSGGNGTMDEHLERIGTGPQFPVQTYLCSLCGTFCPDALFLEDHVKLMHRDGGVQPSHAASSPTTSLGEGSSSSLCRPGQEDSGTGRPARAKKVSGGYECEECGRHFNYLGNLRQHQRIHTGEKPFTCQDCGERFRHAARLKSHRLGHSGVESPFTCPQCGKGFPVLSGLKRHQRVHTGESPYACPQCGRRFKELGNLYTHQRIHSGATPYSCQQCGRRFRHLGTYKSHRCTPSQPWDGPAHTLGGEAEDQQE